MTALALIRLVKVLFEESPYIAVENVKGLFEQLMHYPIMMNYDNALKLLLVARFCDINTGGNCFK